MHKFFNGLWLVITLPYRAIVSFIRVIRSWFAAPIQRVRSFLYEEEEDVPIPDAFAKVVQNPQGVLYHLNILRHHLFRAIAAIATTTALSFFFINQILSFLASPLEGGLASLTAIDVTENVGTVMRVALLFGFALAFPYVVLEIWLFIAPGVSPKTRLRGLAAIPIAVALFLLGMTFTYYVMLPVALPFLFNFMGLNTVPRPSSYFNFVTGIMFWIGIAFEFPMVAYVLAELGILIQKHWRSMAIGDCPHRFHLCFAITDCRSSEYGDRNGANDSPLYTKHRLDQVRSTWKTKNTRGVNPSDGHLPFHVRACAMENNKCHYLPELVGIYIN
jgi:sec-independent protein translocase protein TatC